MWKAVGHANKYPLMQTADDIIYDPRRCLTLHMYDLNAEFKPHLNRLYDQFYNVFSEAGCRDTIGIIGLATTHICWPHIKMLSYRGAVWDRKRWFDPGNFVHTLFWLLLGQMAHHVLGRRGPSPNVRLVASKWKVLQKMVRTRWPRTHDTNHWLELHGDLLEMTLGVGYMDQDRYWGVIRALSPILAEISDIVTFIDVHGAASRVGRNGPFFRGGAAPYTRKLAVSMYHAMLVQKFSVGPDAQNWADFLNVASHHRLMY
jgi:hypothetical protein